MKARILSPPPILHSAATGRPEVALTFDDGPSRWTAQIAAVLEQHDCRATFFLRGPAVEERPGDLASLAAAGHEIGNHLWTHSDANRLSRAEIRAEIRCTAKAVRGVTGQRPTLVRPPYLKAPEAVAAAARWTGTKAIVQSSITVGDWKAGSAEEIFTPVLERVTAGDIVCLHDGISSDKRDTDSREPTVAAVKHLVPGLLERGLQPVTVSRLFDELGGSGGIASD